MHEAFLREALAEARRGAGKTRPNPAVGAVIVRAGEIIGRGFHRRAGEPHAEIEALRSLAAPADARGATLYVTLEPCSTFGQTPPCTEAVLAAGIARVVVGAVDPNPAHQGRGLAWLAERGVEVIAGMLAEECAELNVAWNFWIATGQPWVVAKVGMSLDGRLTRPPGESQWLTNPASRQGSHELRAQVDAILIGAETLRTDNPRLTVRGIDDPAPLQPWRIVLTRTGDLPADAHLFTDAHRDRTRVFQDRPLREVLAQLGAEGVQSVLIEGGMRVLGEAWDGQLVRRAHFFIAPRLTGGPKVAGGGLGVPASALAPRLRAPHYKRLGDDLHVWGDVIYPPVLAT